MTIVDLRQLSSRQIEPLLAEEAQRWREELRWDYRSSLDLIKKFVEARSLAGCAALENGEAAGYAFYVIEEHKGLLGGLYVSPRFPQMPLATKLLTSTLETLRAVPYIGRIEAQLVPFGCEFDAALAKHGFRLYPRQFMLLDLNRRPRKLRGERESVKLKRAIGITPRRMERSLLHSVRAPYSISLRGPYGRRNQRSVSQRRRRAEVSEEHHRLARLRAIPAARLFCFARAPQS